MVTREQAIDSWLFLKLTRDTKGAPIGKALLQSASEILLSFMMENIYESECRKWIDVYSKYVNAENKDSGVKEDLLQDAEILLSTLQSGVLNH